MQTDYLQLWRELVNHTFQTPSDELLTRYKKHALQKAERPDPLMEFVLINVKPGSTVLDIGAGSGRWTIPLARKAGSVTAIEPSQDMIAVLRQNLAAARLENVNIVRATWETAEAPVHDVTVCTHAAYYSPDLAGFARKMERLSRQTCYLGMRLPSADGIMGELSRAIYGRHHDSANGIIAYNALYSMGIYCNILVENEIYHWTNDSLEEAFIRAKRHLRLESNESYDGLIRDVLARRLTVSGNRYIWPDGMRSQLLWWTPAASS